MKKWLLLIVLASLVAFVIKLIVHLGFFREVKISLRENPEIQTLLKLHVGAYHQIVDSLNEVQAFAMENHIPCTKTIAQFLDNPEVVEESRLRAEVGCYVEGAKDSDWHRVILPENLHWNLFPARKYLQADFAGSPSIGPFKVYSRVKELARENRQTLDTWNLEIYEILSEKEMHTMYLFPLLISP